MYKYLLVIINIVALSVLFHMVFESDDHQRVPSLVQLPPPPNNIDNPRTILDPLMDADTQSYLHQHPPCPSQETLSNTVVDSTIVKSKVESKSRDNVRKVLEQHSAEISRAFANHPSHSVKDKVSLEEYMQFLATRSQCHGKPM
jgi:hypothetical protein